MGAGSTPEIRRAGFQELLNCAIVEGSFPADNGVLGPRTTQAIILVAQAHPDASPDLIAAAYDAYFAEHGGGQPATDF